MKKTEWTREEEHHLFLFMLANKFVYVLAGDEGKEILKKKYEGGFGKSYSFDFTVEEIDYILSRLLNNQDDGAVLEHNIGLCRGMIMMNAKADK